MIELTEQQQCELKGGQEYPPRVVNPRTQETFFLLPAELYARVRAFLEDEDEIGAIEEMYPLVSQVLEKGDEFAKESA